MDNFDWKNYKDLMDNDTEARDIFAKNLAEEISNQYTKVLGSFLNNDFKDPEKTLTMVGEILTEYYMVIAKKKLKNFIDIEYIEGLDSGKYEGKIYAIQRVHSIDI